MSATHVAILDCLGKTCPQPIMACNALLSRGAPQNLRVLVSDQAARENVTRFLGAHGYTVTSAQDGNTWRVEGVLATPPATVASPEEFPCPVPTPEAKDAKTVVFLTAETIGQGDPGLGSKLMGNFLKTLPELGSDLFRIVMVNGAVRLSTPDNPNFAALKALEDSGITVLVCGTCLEFFGLLPHKAVGQTTNMLDVVTSLQLASKVITI